MDNEKIVVKYHLNMKQSFLDCKFNDFNKRILVNGKDKTRFIKYGMAVKFSKDTSSRRRQNYNEALSDHLGFVEFCKRWVSVFCGKAGFAVLCQWIPWNFVIARLST